jgi:aminoglycoside 6'-N-acetyltransferase
MIAGVALAGPVLQGERVLLRPVVDADLPELLRQLAHPEVAAWWGRNSEEELREELSEPQVTPWTIEVDGAIAGLIYATEEQEPDYRNVEVDLFLSADHHGRGLGAEALRLVLREMFDQRGHHRAVIVPAAENQRAIHSYEGVGFKPVGVLRQADRGLDGRWRDALVMDLLAGELHRP